MTGDVRRFLDNLRKNRYDLNKAGYKRRVLMYLKRGICILVVVLMLFSFGCFTKANQSAEKQSEDNTQICPVCHESNSAKAKFCAFCGANLQAEPVVFEPEPEPELEPEPENGGDDQQIDWEPEYDDAESYKTVNVYDISRKSLSIDAIEQQSITIPGAEILTYHGNMANENQVDRYTLTAPYSGTYRIDISGMYSGTAFELGVKNSLGDYLEWDGYCANEGMTVRNLVAGETYDITIEHYLGETDYTMTIGLQKQTYDISNCTVITDSTEFVDQSNLYTFTAPRSGRYLFSFSEIMNQTSVFFMISNTLGETVGYDSYCGNGEMVEVDLVGNQLYTIEVSQENGLSNYILSVGYQKETTDITDCGMITDSMEFYHQKNVYLFTVPLDGQYHFELSGMMNKASCSIYVMNRLEEVVAENWYCNNGKGVTVRNAVAGETLRVEVSQSDQYSSYQLTIGYQKETIAIGGYTIINDRLTYEDQNNIYSFTADRFGSFVFTISGMMDGTRVEVTIRNDLNEAVETRYCRNWDYIVLENITEGTHFEVQVSQSNGLSDYTLTVD